MRVIVILSLFFASHAMALASAPGEPGLLRLGERVTGELIAGGSDLWRLTLPPGQLAAVEVRQTGGDMRLTLFDPAGAAAVEVDDTEPQDEEALRWVADTAGEWHVAVAPFDPSAAGAYEIEWTELREATDRDRQSWRAAQLDWELRQRLAQGDTSDALDRARRLADLYEQTLSEDPPALARALLFPGSLLLDARAREAARPLLKRSVELLESHPSPDPDLFAEASFQLGRLEAAENRFGEAERLYLRARDLWQRVLGPTHRYVAIVLTKLADLYRAQGRYGEVESLYLEALSIAKSLSDTEGEARCLNNLGVLYVDLARYADAQRVLEAALALKEAAPERDEVSIAKDLINLGEVHRSRGRPEEADRLYVRALEKLPDRPGDARLARAVALNQRAQVRMDQGRYAEAETFFRQSLVLFDKEAPLRAASTRLHLGMVLLGIDRDAEAEEMIRLSLETREKLLGRRHPEVGLSLAAHAMVLDLRGRYIEAATAAEHAVGVLSATSAHPEAQAHAYGVRALLRRHRWLDPEGGLNDLSEALKIVEGILPELGGDETSRAFFLAQFGELFHTMVAWQLEDGHLENAFETLERRRSRALVEQLAAAGVDWRAAIPEDLRSSLLAREAAARLRLSELQRRLLEVRGDEEVAKAADLLREAEREYSEVYEQVKNASSLWKRLGSGKPADLATAQRDLVPAGGLLLVYEVGQNESFLFVVPPTGERPEALALEVSIEAAAVLGLEPGPLGARDLARILLGIEGSENGDGGLLAGLSRRSRTVATFFSSAPRREALAKLHALWRVLVPGELWKRLAMGSEVVVMPDGPLHRFPLEALVVQPATRWRDAVYWLDAGPVIRYAPSASALLAVQERPDPPARRGTARDILSLSDPIFDPADLARSSGHPVTAGSRSAALLAEGPLPRLPGTTREKDKLLELFGRDRVEVLERTGATEAALRTALPEKRWLHLATHGLVDEASGSLFASLVLTPPLDREASAENDGMLQLHEIYDLDLAGCELAVLSACRTNSGTEVEGEGVFALSRGMLVAGARRVVASQWSVDDDSTAELMKAFFSGLRTPGSRLDYARALRDARLEVRRMRNWAPPYHWAPFVLIGAP